jgi:glycosyltransferase involved in cell wall biosynthesis
MDKNLIPKISVLMPVFNCCEYIEESVSSIINQTFTDFEFLIIDDCSTDGTFEYLKSLSDQRINLIRKPENTGYTVSLNMGLHLAKGKYIARMDGDDISFPDRFAKQVAYMDNNPDVIVCGGGYKAIGSDFKFIPKSSYDDIIIDLLSFTPIAHPTVFLRNNILKNNNILYNPEYEPAEDYKMWTILSEYGKLANLNDILLYYRVHQNQTSKIRINSQKEISKLISFEYIRKLSKNNEYIDLFYKIKIETIDDFKKYEKVEAVVKSTLKERGIKKTDNFFLERKKPYLNQVLINRTYNILQVFKNLKLLFRYRLVLGNGLIIRYIIRSLYAKK